MCSGACDGQTCFTQRLLHKTFAALNMWSLFTKQFKPPWPNGQGVGLLIRRLRVRVPQGVCFVDTSCCRCVLCAHSCVPSTSAATHEKLLWVWQAQGA